MDKTGRKSKGGGLFFMVLLMMIRWSEPVTGRIETAQGGRKDLAIIIIKMRRNI
ncbi:MAG: hypothetical protein NT096_02505 [Proteobacteria bacterium]|nr:hypothetical protein [Pseudomonadota bacterium]